jgi:dTDP-4-dehydrorhamnose 3,5-epimerase-like enzyme
MSLVNWLHFRGLGDERGELHALEGGRNIPFEIRRVYYMTGMKPDLPRGFHAHRALRQVAICLAGRCRMTLDDGTDRESVWLDSPASGLLVEHGVWHEMHDFSVDCVLMMLASDYYDEGDYIRSYEEFSKAVSR